MRIVAILFATGLAAGTPTLAQDLASAPKAVSSISARPIKSGVMTVNGKSFPIFSLQAGDMVADAIPSKPGQPMHTGPMRYEPLRVSVDVAGLLTLKPAVDSLLATKPVPFDATILYNGRKLTITGARLSFFYLPSCYQGKAVGGAISLTMQVEKVTVASEAEPTQSVPAKLTGCTVTLDGIPANGILGAAPGPSFSLLTKEADIGEIRHYEEDVEEPRKVAAISLTENKDAPGLAEWARNDILKGIGESKSLHIVYATAAGPALKVSYGTTLVKRAPLDLNNEARVILATENPSITKP